jgi:hypothetical protein
MSEATVGEPITLEGRRTTLRVLVESIIDPAEPSSRAPDEGNRLVAVELLIENVGEGAYEGHPFGGALLIDVDSRQHRAGPANTTSCEGFDGRVTLVAGDTRRGCAQHQLAEGVALRSFQFKHERSVGVWRLEG